MERPGQTDARRHGEGDPQRFVHGDRERTRRHGHAIALDPAQGVGDATANTATSGEAKAEAIYSDELVQGDLNVAVTEQFSGSELRGFAAWTRAEKDGVCPDRELDTNTLTLAGDTLTLSSRTQGLEDVPSEPEGFCNAGTPDFRLEAVGAPCVSSAEVVAERD